MNPNQIPIINYHKIEAQMDVGVTTRHPQRFARDMRLLKDMGYQTFTFHDILSGQETESGKKPLMITFDDGYESVYTRAFPVMKELGFRGVVYVPGAYIGKENTWDVQFGGKRYRHLNRGQLLELQRAGFEIGAHGVHHRALTVLGAEDLRNELNGSKNMLEEALGILVVSFCYPFGQFNKTVAAQVRAAGYRFALASMYWGNGEATSYALKRMNIYRFDSEKTFRKKILPKPPSWLVLRDWVIQRGALATVWYQKLADRS